MAEKEKLEKVRDLRPIDDVFFEVLAQNKGVCQEILRTIMEDSQLTIQPLRQDALITALCMLTEEQEFSLTCLFLLLK